MSIFKSEVELDLKGDLAAQAKSIVASLKDIGAQAKLTSKELAAMAKNAKAAADAVSVFAANAAKANTQLAQANIAIKSIATASKASATSSAKVADNWTRANVIMQKASVNMKQMNNQNLAMPVVPMSISRPVNSDPVKEGAGSNLGSASKLTALDKLLPYTPAQRNEQLQLLRAQFAKKQENDLLKSIASGKVSDKAGDVNGFRQSVINSRGTVFGTPEELMIPTPPMGGWGMATEEERASAAYIKQQKKWSAPPIAPVGGGGGDGSGGGGPRPPGEPRPRGEDPHRRGGARGTHSAGHYAAHILAAGAGMGGSIKASTIGLAGAMMGPEAMLALGAAYGSTEVMKPGFETAHQMAVMGSNNMSAGQIATMLKASYAANVLAPGSTTQGNMALGLDLNSIVSNPALAAQILPQTAAFKQSISGVAGDKAENQSYDAIKFMENRGHLLDKNGNLNMKVFQDTLSMIGAIATGTNDRVSPSDLLGFQNMGGGLAASQSIQSLAEWAPIIQILKDQKTGTALTALGRQFLGDKMTQQVFDEDNKMDMFVPGTQHVTGGKGQRKTYGATVIGQAEFQSDTPKWVNDYLVPVLKAKGITTDDQISAEVYKMFGTSTEQRATSEMLRNLILIMKDSGRLQGLDNTTPTQRLQQQALKDPTIALDALGASINNLAASFATPVAIAMAPRMLAIANDLNTMAQVLNTFKLPAWLDYIINHTIKIPGVTSPDTGGGGFFSFPKMTEPDKFKPLPALRGGDVTVNGRHVGTVDLNLDPEQINRILLGDPSIGAPHGLDSFDPSMHPTTPSAIGR